MTIEWQPIETAPKDGTELLVADVYGGVSIAAWSNNAADIANGSDKFDGDVGWYRRAEGDWDLFDSFGPQCVDPIHWMPIPPPPSA